MFDLTGKTALVTGATGGIGGAIARALHERGATVALSGRQVDKLEALKTELSANTTVLVKGSRFMRMERVVDAVAMPAVPAKEIK